MLNHVDTTSVNASNAHPGVEQRRHPRHPVNWPAMCVVEGRDGFEAVIVDVSEGGFGLKGPVGDIPSESTIYIDFDQIGAFRCRLAWSNGARFGVEILDDAEPGDGMATINLTDALRGMRSKK